MKTSELVFTAEETRMRGLELVGFDKRRQNKCNLALNNRRFRAHFGSHPMVYAELWYDLQSTNVEDAKICGSKDSFDQFLMSIHFLKVYGTEHERSGVFDTCERTSRKWIWFYAAKIQALKKEKVNQINYVGCYSFMTLNPFSFFQDSLACSMGA